LTDPYESVLDEVEADLKRNNDAPDTDVEAFLESRLARLRDVPLPMHPGRQAQILIDIANQYYIHGQKIFRAVEPIAMAVLLAEQENNKFLLRRALSNQGLILGETNAIGAALDSLRRALDLAEELKDTLGVAAAWLNMGVTLSGATLYGDARSALERAVSTCAQITDPRRALLEGNAQQCIALCCLNRRDFGSGLAASVAAIALLDEPKTRIEDQARVLAEATYCRLLVESDRIGEAARRVELALPYAERSKSLRANIAAASMRAMVEVSTGKYEDALSHVIWALEAARAHPNSLTETLQVAVMTHERAGRHESAEAAHSALVEHVRAKRIENIMRNVALPLRGSAGVQEGKASRAPAPSYEPLRQRFNALLARPVPGSSERQVRAASHGQLAQAPSIAERFRPFGWQPWKL
jgi:tetratricopeptide (TPR) repeat protein